MQSIANKHSSDVVRRPCAPRGGLTTEQVIDDLRVLVPNGQIYVLLLATFDQDQQIGFDPPSEADASVWEALTQVLSWTAGPTPILRAPKVPMWLRHLLPLERVLVVPIHWGDWTTGFIVVDAALLEGRLIEALKDYAANLAARIATDDWMARTQSGIMRCISPVPLALAS